MLKIYKVIHSLPEEVREVSDVFRWPFQLKEGFLELLQIPTQECLVIVAYFAMIPEYLSSKWWLEGFGRRLFAKIYPLIDEEHLSWIQWPMQQLGVTSEGGFINSRLVLCVLCVADALLTVRITAMVRLWRLDREGLWIGVF